jgi:hypothetical protein
MRPFPDPALSTDNLESETYKTQMLKAPPEAGIAVTPEDAASPASKKIVVQKASSAKAMSPSQAVPQ